MKKYTLDDFDGEIDEQEVNDDGIVVFNAKLWLKGDDHAEKPRLIADVLIPEDILGEIPETDRKMLIKELIDERIVCDLNLISDPDCMDEDIVMLRERLAE
jgi:hypothetical protein